MDDGIRVCKVTTGSHLIEDIKVSVQHDSFTFIPMTLVQRSTDLHKDLGARIIMQMDSRGPQRNVAAEVVPMPKLVQPSTLPAPPPTSQVEQENTQLKALIANMQNSMTSLEKRLEAFMASAPAAATVRVVSEGSVKAAPSPASEVVEIETPMFIPDVSVKDVVGTVQTKSETAEGDSVSEATSKLRAMRRGK